MGGRVLLIEDDPDIRDLVSGVLAEEGFQVTAVRNGAAALASLRRADLPAPDLLLLDVVMPGTDGWRFAAAYCHAPPPRAPLVVFTAHRPGDEVTAALGAAAVIDKPFDLDDLIATVTRYLPTPAGPPAAARGSA